MTFYTIGDFNNDGWFDIYITNGVEGNAFLKNNADGTFTDVAEATGTVFNS
ncbi:FG-GAP repeat domain-containing protein, partial [Winogradskyella sp.]|uniref:FG-GAP repeat domain-containing protein n=1 Tax=Winogradskyella sp. TaxID=1883156 RepID=UPI003518CDB5